MSEQMLAPIELSDAELLVVSGGRGSVAAGVAQAIRQDAVVVQQGGFVSVGGGNGATSFSGNLTVVETFVAAITQVATNVKTSTSPSPYSGGGEPAFVAANNLLPGLGQGATCLCCGNPPSCDATLLRLRSEVAPIALAIRASIIPTPSPGSTACEAHAVLVCVAALGVTRTTFGVRPSGGRGKIAPFGRFRRDCPRHWWSGCGRCRLG
jgi:hypothetical protein